MSQNSITPEVIRRFTESLREPPTRQPVMYFHPIDAIFMEAMFNSTKDFVTVNRLWSECQRKYFMGAKRGIAKWGLNPLIEQYAIRLASVAYTQ